MGLGKTYVGAEKMIQLGETVNLIICQKSKVNDWLEHFTNNYELSHDMMIYDCTRWKKKDWLEFSKSPNDTCGYTYLVLIINYELAWHRPQLLQLYDFTLMLDESSLIQNIKAKQNS